MGASREDVRSWFEDRGVAISDWALANGFSPADVYAALSGRTLGKRGKAHDIAVALGLKSSAPRFDLKGPPINDGAVGTFTNRGS